MLNRMVKKLLKISAFIDSYRYFQIIKEPLITDNQKFFYEVASNYYEDALINIVSKIKRINQSRNSIDFTISL